ncbi:hypothetical protein KIPB_014983, partial [Kipferlia bialata]|eukprot:g14983.t1
MVEVATGATIPSSAVLTYDGAVAAGLVETGPQETKAKITNSVVVDT